MPFNPEQTENLISLLMNKDELNAKVAFEIIENNEFPADLITELFAFFKTASDKKLKQKAKALLEQHASPEVIDAMKLRYPLKGGGSTMAATEKTIKKNSNFSSKITPMSFHHDLSKMTGLETLRINISGMRNQEYYFMERFKELIPNCEVTIGY